MSKPRAPRLLPEKVVILGYSFDVTEASLDNEDDAGDSNATARRVAVDDGLPPSTRVETFYHEVAHMMLDLSGYSSFLDKKLEEALTQMLGVALSQFVSHNPNLPTLKEANG